MLCCVQLTSETCACGCLTLVGGHYHHALHVNQPSTCVFGLGKIKLSQDVLSPKLGIISSCLGDIVALSVNQNMKRSKLLPKLYGVLGLPVPLGPAVEATRTATNAPNNAAALAQPVGGATGSNNAAAPAQPVGVEGPNGAAAPAQHGVGANELDNAATMPFAIAPHPHMPQPQTLKSWVPGRQTRCRQCELGSVAAKLGEKEAVRSR